MPGFGPPADLPAKFKAGNVGKHPIDDGQIGPPLGQRRQTFFAVAGDRNLEAFTLQIVTKKGDDRFFVFNDQNRRTHYF